jgi:hypothetical protein
MAGVGPEWVHVRQGGAGFHFLTFEKKGGFGWYFEPGYEYGFGRAHERSADLSGGLLIAIR